MQPDARLFETLVDRVRDYAVFLLDPRGHIISWNAGAQLIKGYAPEDIIGRHFSVFYTADALAAGWPDYELKVATREGRFEDEGWRVRKDGSRFWANVVITALRDDDGRLLGFSKITRDLTQRQQQEEALRQSEESFRLLIEGVADYAIFRLDPQGIITSWNSGGHQISGFSREEVLGKHFSLLYSAEDIDAGAPWEELAMARRNGRAEAEGWRVRKSGERFRARVVLSALHDRNGQLRGYAKVIQDLTQREYARGLEQAAERVNEFIAMLAHELRNPLAPIRNAVEIMGRLPPNDPGVQPLRLIIDRQSAQLARIVDDMLDASRITRGRLEIHRSDVDLAEVVARAVELATPGIAQAQQALHLELPAETVFVNGDLFRLTQVLGNLLTNAVRFTRRGGNIWVTVRKERERAVLGVRDDGQGIPASSLQTIFGLFVQGAAPLHPVGAGLGVGLALARRIVSAHDGTIEARSEGEGKGSEFVVRLPALAQAPAVEQAVRAPRARRSRGSAAASQRILIVDDNVDAAVALELLLQSLGHETKVAHDGRGGLAAVEKFRPDVVLIDIGLPDVSGYEVARRLRQRKGKMKIIAVTGWGDEVDRERSTEAGFDVHLVKPVEEAALLELLGGAQGKALH